MINILCCGFIFFSTKIETHVGMAERLVGDLAIEEAPKIEIKATLEQKINSMCNVVLYHMIKETKTR